MSRYVVCSFEELSTSRFSFLSKHVLFFICFFICFHAFKSFVSGSCSSFGPQSPMTRTKWWRDRSKEGHTSKDLKGNSNEFQMPFQMQLKGNSTIFNDIQRIWCLMESNFGDWALCPALCQTLPKSPYNLDKCPALATHELTGAHIFLGQNTPTDRHTQRRPGQQHKLMLMTSMLVSVEIEPFL